jgi:hypothetical protein
MMNFLKRWLGWESDSGLFNFKDLEIDLRPRSTPPPRRPTSSAAKRAAPTPRGTGPTGQRTPPPQAPKPAARAAQPPKPKKRASPAEILDNPLLSLDRPTEDGFDPYNTGAFNRSASWERIGRRKR